MFLKIYFIKVNGLLLPLQSTQLGSVLIFVNSIFHLLANIHVLANIY